jgi:glycosyltransferase involved in cell wall biosynthesis
MNSGVHLLGVSLPASRLERPLVWWRLFRHVLRLQPDAVHFHDPELLLLIPFFRLFLRSKTRIIYDVHEYFVASLANKYWIPAGLRPIAVKLAGKLEKLLASRADGILCAVQEQTPIYDYFDGPVTVARNLPRAALFEEPTPHPSLDVEGFKLIYVGLILPKRGIDTLLEAMYSLYQQGKTDIKLFLLGAPISPAYIGEIRAFIKKNQLEQQIQWLGYIPHEELKHYLANAHVGIAPGRHTKQYQNPGISTKLFEYMLGELPIITSDQPHRRRYIEESDCGLVVSAEDAQAHVDAILRLYTHPDEAKAMGQRGKKMVLDHYTWESEIPHLLDFYQDVLNPAGPLDG